MGRAGVTLQEVEKAALQLQGRGKNPSVDAVREVIGTGSKSTIAQHLRDWKAQQSYASENCHKIYLPWSWGYGND